MGDFKKKRMKRSTFIIFVLVLWLATCKAPEPNMPAPTDIFADANGTSLGRKPAVLPRRQNLPFPRENCPLHRLTRSRMSTNRPASALDIPTGWTINETVVAHAGHRSQFLSSHLNLPKRRLSPRASTRVSAVIYQWDPKNDLAAYVQQRKTAWEASSFSRSSKNRNSHLELGLPAVLFTSHHRLLKSPWFTS